MNISTVSITLLLCGVSVIVSITLPLCGVSVIVSITLPLCGVSVIVSITLPLCGVSVIVSAIEGRDVEYKQVKQLESKDLTEEIFSTIYTGLHKLLLTALRHPVESLKQEVTNELGHTFIRPH